MSIRLIAAIVSCAALAAAPAHADRGHGRGFYRQPHGAVVVERTVVYRAQPRVVYAGPAYYPAPVYYGPPASYGPSVVYAGHHHHRGCGHDDDAWKWVAGGAIAGAILYGLEH
jgi:hypothetical protein